nr:hypothetical transcript [Hymenolepis microstoma]
MKFLMVPLQKTPAKSIEVKVGEYHLTVSKMIPLAWVLLDYCTNFTPQMECIHSIEHFRSLHFSPLFLHFVTRPFLNPAHFGVPGISNVDVAKILLKSIRLQSLL